MAEIEEQVPEIMKRIRRVLATARLDQPEYRAKAAMEMCRIVSVHQSHLVRGQYALLIADTTMTAPTRVIEIMEEIRAEASRSAERAVVAALEGVDLLSEFQELDRGATT